MTPRLRTLLPLLLGVAHAALAQPLLPPQAPPGYDLSDKEKDKVRVVAVQASQQGSADAGMDDTLRPFAKFFKSMPEFNTFHLVSDATADITRGEETEIPIDARYAMHVVTGVGSEQNKLNLAARITLDGKVDALRAQGVTEPGKTIVFRGMDHPPGELVVLLQIVKEQNDQRGQPQNGEDQNQDQQQNQQDQQQQKANKDQQDEEQQEEKQGQPAEDQQQLAKAGEEKDEEKAAAQKEDAANIEALLQSLDEVDRREQQNMLNANKRFPKIHGDWW